MPKVLRFADFVLDGNGPELLRGGTPVAISPKALQLLELLVTAAPKVVTREQIVDALWPDVIVEEANVRNLIAEVRSALGDERLIRTAHRVGYAFAGRLRNRTLVRLVDDAQNYYLSDGPNLIGRDPECAVSLETTGVSRRHAQITVTSEGVILEDLGSKNGTRCNGRRIDRPVELHDGDQIEIGMATLTFRVDRGDHSTTTVRPEARGRS